MANLISTRKYILPKKNITWGDGTVENVGIDIDRYFVLDGVKRQMLGFHIGRNYPAANGAFNSTANLALLETELTYLQSKGIRLLEFCHFYNGIGSENDCKTTLQKCYDHKMFVLMDCRYKDVASYDANVVFDSLGTLDFAVYGSTASITFGAFVDMALTYPNVLVFSLENEPDFQQTGQHYSVPLMTSYVAARYAIVKAKTNLPVTIKFIGNNYQDFYLTMRSSLYSYSDIISFDPYDANVSATTTNTALLKAECVRNNRSDKIWFGEFGAPDSSTPQAASMITSMITAGFANGASVIFLFVMNNQTVAGWSYFDDNGAPIANTDTLLANLPTWQAPL